MNRDTSIVCAGAFRVAKVILKVRIKCEGKWINGTRDEFLLANIYDLNFVQIL